MIQASEDLIGIGSGGVGAGRGEGGGAVGALLIVCAGLLGTPGAGADDPLLAEYRRAAAAVGRDADAHVRLALWCEARGLGAERVKHLALAVLHRPSHPTARGLMGLVAYRDRWQPPEAVAARV